MRGHADAATLAAFREELLSHRKAAQVSAHLAACPRCAALDAQLAEVTVLLTHAAAPPMPDTVTARIEVALAAEAAARGPAPVTDPIAAGHRRTGHGRPQRHARHRRAGRGPGRRQPPAGLGRPRLVQARAARRHGRRRGRRHRGRRLHGRPVAVRKPRGARSHRLRRRSPGQQGEGRPAPHVHRWHPVGGREHGPRRRDGTGPGGQQRHQLPAGPARRPGQHPAQGPGPETHSGAHPGPTLATPNGYLAQFPDLQACAAHIAGAQHALPRGRSPLPRPPRRHHHPPRPPRRPPPSGSRRPRLHRHHLPRPSHRLPPRRAVNPGPRSTSRNHLPLSPSPAPVNPGTRSTSRNHLPLSPSPPFALRQRAAVNWQRRLAGCQFATVRPHLSPSAPTPALCPSAPTITRPPSPAPQPCRPRESPGPRIG